MHTPGPYHVTDDPNCGDGLGILDQHGRRLAHTSAVRNLKGKILSPDMTIEAAEAQDNARLFAAAPQMVETLEKIAGFAPGNGDVCEIIARRARDALRAAYGEQPIIHPTSD